MLVSIIMKYTIMLRLLLFASLLFSFCTAMTGVRAQQNRMGLSANRPKKIVLIAGEKSHAAGYHEYIKTVRLLKTMLDHSNAKGIKTEMHLQGWPQHPATLEDADLILFISDGRDGPLYSEVPFMTPERMPVMERQMKRGCGFSVIHFSTFAPDATGEKILEWGGGYFDWQDEAGQRNWYSAIKTVAGSILLPAAGHPVLNGVKPFKMKDEFYYNIRFREQDSRLKAIVEVPELEGSADKGNVTAWTVERADGGRGFSTTMGHYYDNWQNPDFRKLVLNGIVWAAKATVPEKGVEARFYSDQQVTQYLYGKSRKALLLTGNHHPSHPWQETTPLIKAAVEQASPFFVDVSTNIEDLSQYDLKDYDLLILNYCNWKDATGLSEKSRAAFTGYLNQGGGLMILHFANGAFHYSLPDAAASDWPEYRRIVRRVWDHNSDSAHDKFGTFRVKVTNQPSVITEGIRDFETLDELYYNQKGEEPIVPLLTARSNVTQQEEPLAWVYQYGKARVFQTLLGHNASSFQAPEMKKLLRNAAVWVAGENP
jgi:type 1 glutamine amidotransferase